MKHFRAKLISIIAFAFVSLAGMNSLAESPQDSQHPAQSVQHKQAQPTPTPTPHPGDHHAQHPTGQPTPHPNQDTTVSKTGVATSPALMRKVKVRSWNPEKKQEITGEAKALKSVIRIKAETDPAPFPVRGKVEIYLEISQLSIAINGTPTSEYGLELDGQNLRTTLKNYVPLKTQNGVTFKVKGEGLISSRVQAFAEDDGEKRLYVPLEDVAKAFGARVKVRFPWHDQNTIGFTIKVDNCLDCLLEYLPLEKPIR